VIARDPYDRTKPRAENIKALLQMAIGVVAAIVILVGLLWGMAHHDDTGQLSRRALARIALALIISAAIELAYTLFTPGPDEVLDPLMLGLSATLLLNITDPRNKFGWQLGLATVLFAAAIGGLFAARKYLADLPQSSDRTDDKTNGDADPPRNATTFAKHPQ
jgi:hypothetical protein